MNIMKRTIGVVTLTCCFGAVALGCAPLPGIMETPPCVLAPQAGDDLTDPGIMQTPPATDTVDVISVVEAALIELLVLW